MRFKGTIALVAALICLTAVLAAQEITGTIVGTVTDASGAVIPAAKVVVTNTDRNAIIRTLTSSREGEYVAALLPIGHYQVEISAPGFKTYSKRGIELNVNDRLTVSAQLPPGAVNETVNVEASAQQVDTQTATSQGLINGIQIRELALSARNYEEMVALMPGVSSAVTDTIFVGVETPGGGTNQVSFSINGQRFSQNNWTVDGADNVDRGGNFSLLNYPSVDAIEEFRVLRSEYSPEYGRAAGGQINVITRSGTSHFHGGLYEFFRNDDLNANRFFNNRFDLPRPALKYNDFGWTLGGPIYVPGHFNKEKNKTFFFYSEEIRRIVTDSTSESTVPNADERQGIFSTAVCIKSSEAGCITVLPKNTQLDPGLINPAATAYLTDVFAHIPLPQDPSTDQLFQSGKNRFNYRQEIIRIDHTFSPKLSVTGRWMNDSIPTINPDGLFNFTNVLGYASTDTNSPGRNLLVRATMSLTPKLLNEAGYAWSYGAIVSHTTGFSNVSAAPNVASAITLPFPSAIPRIPNLDFNDLSGLSGFGPYGDFNRNHNILDTLTWIQNRHTWKFGFSYHRYQKSENDAGGFTEPNGGFGFSDIDPTGQSTVQQEWVNFLLGNASSFRQADRDFRAEIRQRTLELFAQDEFRWRKNVTLTYGVRYSRYAQPTDANGHNTSFFPGAYDPSKAPPLVAIANDDGTFSVELCTPATVNPDTGTCDGLIQPNPSPNPNFNRLNGLIVSAGNTSAIGQGATASPFGGAITGQNNHNFAPRLGIAWDPRNDGKTALRAGYGVFFDSPAIGFVENNTFVNPPFVNNKTISNTSLDKPGSGALDAPSPLFLKGVTPNWHLPYTQSWSLDVQHELPKGIILDVGYYGNKGTHLLGIVDINQPKAGDYLSLGIVPSPITDSNFQLVDLVRPFKGYGPINEYTTIFNSHYHSLQATVQKRFSGGLIGINYTWSHALTNAGNDASSPQNNHDLRAEYGPADFDRRHIFTANFVYELPWLKHQQGLVGHLLGGWEFSGIITLNSGLYLTALGTNGIDPAGLGLLDPNTQTDNLNFTGPARPDQIANPNAGARHTVEEWFNTSAFTDPPDTCTNHCRPGNARRGSIKGPGLQRWDLSLFKNIKVTEGTNFQFRLESFNVFNHTNFDAVDTSFTSPTFGQVTSTHEPRIVQLALKFNF